MVNFSKGKFEFGKMLTGRERFKAERTVVKLDMSDYAKMMGGGVEILEEGIK